MIAFFSSLSKKVLTFKNHGVILENASHCWFARERAVSFGNRVWVGQVYNDGTGYASSVLQVNTNTMEALATRLSTVAEYDDHNEPSFLIRSSDNRLFTCYAEHSGNRIRTRISTNPLDSSSWQDQKSYNLGNGKYTYPSCFEDSSGNIWIFSRDDGVSPKSWSYIKSTDGGETFSGHVEFFYGDGARGYLNTFQSDIDKNIIHFIGTGGHPTNSTVCKVFHFYFDCLNETFHKSDGTDVTGNLLLTGSNDMTVIMDNVLPNTGWIEDLIVVNGKPRALMTYYPNGKTTASLVKELYYSEWSGTAWTTPYKIHISASKYMATEENLQLKDYPPVASFARWNPNLIIAGKEVSGVAEIHAISRMSNDNFTSKQLTFNSTYDQWRPITVKSNKCNVFWLNKISYPDYEDSYNQELIMATIS